MEVKAHGCNLRIAATKVRSLVELVKGKNVTTAVAVLKFTPHKGARLLLQVLKSAIANAKNNYSLDESNLYLKKILVNEGPVYKRWLPRAHGSADEILKRTSHISIVLDERVKTPDKKVFQNLLMKRKRDQKIAEKRFKESERMRASSKMTDLKGLSAKSTVLEEETAKEFQKLKQFRGREEREKKKEGFLSKLFRRKAE